MEVSRLGAAGQDSSSVPGPPPSKYALENHPLWAASKPSFLGNRTSSNSPARTCAPPKALSTRYPQLTTLST